MRSRIAASVASCCMPLMTDGVSTSGWASCLPTKCGSNEDTPARALQDDVAPDPGKGRMDLRHHSEEAHAADHACVGAHTSASEYRRDRVGHQHLAVENWRRIPADPEACPRPTRGRQSREHRILVRGGVTLSRGP